jgi:hypothetical protein
MANEIQAASSEMERFEQWAKSVGGADSFSLTRNGDGYEFVSMQNFWECWQASILSHSKDESAPSVAYMFACGGSLRPGTLYFTKGNNPDSAPDTNQIEVTSPSEPLQNGCIVNGFAQVFSTDRAWIAPSELVELVRLGLSGLGANGYVPLFGEPLTRKIQAAIRDHDAHKAAESEVTGKLVEAGWLIWSNDHGTWWGPNRGGYTRVVKDAGRYTLAEAWQIMRARDFRCGSKLGELRQHEPGVFADFVVPSPELIDALALYDAHTNGGKGANDGV